MFQAYPSGDRVAELLSALGGEVIVAARVAATGLPGGCSAPCQPSSATWRSCERHGPNDRGDARPCRSGGLPSSGVGNA